MMWVVNCIKSVYDNSLACVRVKRCESECFRTDSGVRKVCIMSLWLFSVYMDAAMKEVKMGMGRREESGYCLDSSVHITWFCAVTRRKN